MQKHNKITLLFLNHTGAAIRQMTASKTIIGVSVALFVIGIFLLGYFAYDYAHLKAAALTTRNLEKIIIQQNESIEDQRKQIEIFANKIDVLKSNLVGLRKLEKKIKIVANLEESTEQKNLFGIGGSIPEDLDANRMLSNSHSSLLREMHSQLKQLQLASIQQKESFEDLLKLLIERENLLACTPSIMPTNGWIASKFGYRKSPFTGIREFHKGLDIAAEKGTKIFATADGIITFTGRNGLFGKMMTIDHGHGMATRYAHINTFLKKSGDTVKRGEAIALVGNTGRSTGPHVHYEVLLNGIQVNPEKYILN